MNTARIASKFFIILLVTSVMGLAATTAASEKPQASIEKMWHNNSKVMVMAHRGDHRRAPENTILAYENAIASGAQFIEIDSRLTMDNHWVVYHNRVVRLPNGERMVLSSMSFNEVRKLKIKGAQHGLPDQQIPTLDEVLTAMKGKVLIYIDDKMGRPLELAEIIRQHGMEDQVVVGIGDYADALLMSEFAKDIAWRVRVKPMKNLMAKFLKLKPRVVEINDVFALNKEMIDMIHKAGAMIMVNSADEGDVAAEYSLYVEKVGADIIQTDDLDRLVGYLEKRATKSTQLINEPTTDVIN